MKIEAQAHLKGKSRLEGKAGVRITGSVGVSKKNNPRRFQVKIREVRDVV